METPAYRLIRSRRRTLELRIGKDGQVELRAPYWTGRAEIDAFVTSRQHWLQRALQQTTAQPVRPVWHCHEGASVYFLGKPLRLCFGIGKTTAELLSGQLYLSLPPGKEQGREALLESWYRAQARRHFEIRIDHHFPYFAARGYVRPTLRIGKMHTRWGSLSSCGNMNLNLALMQFPEDCIDYVVVHELCHLVYMNHGPRFKALQTALLPDWKERRQQLETLASTTASPFAG